MTGDQIEEATRRFEMEVDPVVESVKQETYDALYANYVEFIFKEHCGFMSYAEIENDIITLGEALKQGRV